MASLHWELFLPYPFTSTANTLVAALSSVYKMERGRRLSGAPSFSGNLSVDEPISGYRCCSLTPSRANHLFGARIRLLVATWLCSFVLFEMQGTGLSNCLIVWTCCVVLLHFIHSIQCKTIILHRIEWSDRRLWKEACTKRMVCLLKIERCATKYRDGQRSNALILLKPSSHKNG